MPAADGDDRLARSHKLLSGRPNRVRASTCTAPAGGSIHANLPAPIAMRMRQLASARSAASTRHASSVPFGGTIAITSRASAEAVARVMSTRRRAPPATAGTTSSPRPIAIAHPPAEHREDLRRLPPQAHDRRTIDDGTHIGDISKAFTAGHRRRAGSPSLRHAPIATEATGCCRRRIRIACFRENVATTCGKCHVGFSETFATSVHGQELAKGNSKAPVCTDCHAAHAITRTDTPPVHPRHRRRVRPVPRQAAGCDAANHRSTRPIAAAITARCATRINAHGAVQRLPSCAPTSARIDDPAHA